MKNFLLFILMIQASVAFGAYPRPRDVSNELNTSPVGARVRLGTQLMDKAVHVLRAQWSYADQGGAVGTIDLRDIDGKKAVLPPGAIVKDCIILVDAALGSSGSPLVSFSSGQILEDIKLPTAHTVFGTNDGLVGCTITGTSSTWMKMPGNYTKEYTPGYTSEFTPTMRITGTTLTRGKLKLILEYILSR